MLLTANTMAFSTVSLFSCTSRYQNNRSILNEFLQKVLKESPKLSYKLQNHKQSEKKRCRLQIEEGEFYGDFCCCEIDAKESAASQAMTEIHHMEECDLRAFLKMPRKHRFATIDEIREQMKSLKKFVKGMASKGDMMYRVGQIYEHVDEIEKQLQELIINGVDMID